MNKEVAALALKRHHGFGITAIQELSLKWEFRFQFVIVVVLKKEFIRKGKPCYWFKTVSIK